MEVKYLEQKQTSNVAAEIAGKSVDMSMTLNVKSVVMNVHEQLLTAIRSMDLSETSTEKRISFKSEGRRIVALELGKRQVTLHLPKIIVDCTTDLKKTYDARQFGYIRVRTNEQVKQALDVITWCIANSKAPEKDTEKGVDE